MVWSQVDALIDLAVDADDGRLPRLPMAAQQQKCAAAQNGERGEQKGPKFRLFHHRFIVGCPAVVVNGFLPWYNGLIFYRCIINVPLPARELRKGGGRRVCRNCLCRAGRALHSAGHRAHRAHPLYRVHVLRPRRAGDLGSSRHAGRQGLSPAALGVPDRPRPQRRHHAALSRRGQRPRRAHAQRRRRVDRQ